MIVRIGVLLLLLLMTTSTPAASAPAPASTTSTAEAQGKPDGSVPGWRIATMAPSGWTADCCQYARAIGVNLVLYQGDWTGDPERVMVLNVWPSRLPSLAAELKADQAHYLKRDPLAKIAAFTLKPSSMPCRGTLYRGTDHIDDVVVFCDPGKAAKVRLSWSMSIADNDSRRTPLEALFRAVVEKSVYTRTPPSPTTSGVH